MVVGEASIHNIMGGMESTGGVRLHNHKRKLKQRFDIIKKLGQGTYGKVQLGINKETGQEVAIKTIKKCKIETEADLIRIRREIQIMSSVQHPNIIHIYEVFENREKMVLVMEYAAGGELYDYLSERKVLSEHEARRIFRQIATAVFYCHKHKICHRDLKLENILLDQVGNAKIADFGLSNVFDEQRLLNTFCGSPLYASPEIVKGTPYHGPEVDCWSLGVLLYTLVYGAMPFDGSNFKRLVKQISQSDYFEPKKPSPASPLIKDMLTVCPARRADIERICTHWWVNEGYEQNCLDIAEELAAQTPVRLDLLLSLVPQSASAEKLVVGDQQSAGDVPNNVSSSDTLIPTRCHSVGSLMDLDQSSSDRRLRRELLEEEPRTAPIVGDAKRKLETTPSMDETAAADAKRKERSRRKEKRDEPEARMYKSASRHHSAPIPNSITEEEAMEVDPMITVPISKTVDLNKIESTAACLELIKECSERSPSKERTSMIHEQEQQSRISSEEYLQDECRASEPLDEGKPPDVALDQTNSAAPPSTPNLEPTSNEKRTSSVTPGGGERFEKSSSSAGQEEPISLEATQREFKKLKEKALSLDSELASDVNVPAKTFERRRSKIFETAEKFNQMASSVESEKPKKIFIPGVNVGGAKRVFERKASLSSVGTPPPAKHTASKIIIDVPATDAKRNESSSAKSATRGVERGEEKNEEEEKEKKKEEAKKRAVDIITGAIGKPPMQRRINGSPPVSPSSQEPKKLSSKAATGANDSRSTVQSVVTPTETNFSFDKKATDADGRTTVSDNDEDNNDNDEPEEPKMSSKMEITLKSATLPRPRKTSKAEISLTSVKPSRSEAPFAFKSELEAKIDAFQPQKLRTQRSEVAFPVAAAVPQANRSSSLEPETRPRGGGTPKERIIPIQVETEHSSTPPPPSKPPPMPQKSAVSQRSGSLSRQSTADSDTDSALGSTVGPEPIRKSPREYIIPIAVEGGGYVTPRSGSVEPENKTGGSSSTSSSANAVPRSRFGRPRRMSSLLSDASEDESPFSSLQRDSEDLLQRHMHRLRSSRPSRQPPEHADSLSSGEDDDDDGFELLTAENLFSTLLSRVRSLTQRLNVDDNRTTGFPSSRLFGRLGSNPSQAFWGLNKPLSRRLSESQFRQSLGRDDDIFSRKGSANVSNSESSNSPMGSHGNPSRETVFDIGSNTLPRDKLAREDVESAEPTRVDRERQESLERSFTPSLARRLSRTLIEQTRRSLTRSPPRSISRDGRALSAERDADAVSEAATDRSISTVSDQTEYKDRRAVRRATSLLEPRRTFDDHEATAALHQTRRGYSSPTENSNNKWYKEACGKQLRKDSLYRSYRADKIQEEDSSVSEYTQSASNQLDATTSSLSTTRSDYDDTSSSSRNLECRLLAAENLIKESKLRNSLGLAAGRSSSSGDASNKFDRDVNSGYHHRDEKRSSLMAIAAPPPRSQSKRRSCIPSLRLRSGSLTRVESTISFADSQQHLRTFANSERSLLGKLFKAAASRPPESKEGQEEEEDKEKTSSRQRRISRFLRPDFFDTPREESRYVKEKEAQKAAENERRKSRFIKRKSEGKSKGQEEEEDALEREKRQQEEDKELKDEMNCLTRDRCSREESSRNGFLHSLEKKLESLRSNDEQQQQQQKKKRENERKIFVKENKGSRERSAPPVDHPSTDERVAVKRTVSDEDLSRRSSREKSTRDDSSKSRVSSVLGLFKTADAKQMGNGQARSPAATFLNRLKKSPPKSVEDATATIASKIPTKSTKSSETSRRVVSLPLSREGARRSASREKEAEEEAVSSQGRPTTTDDDKRVAEKKSTWSRPRQTSRSSVENGTSSSVELGKPQTLDDARNSTTRKKCEASESNNNNDTGDASLKKKRMVRATKKVAKKSSPPACDKTNSVKSRPKRKTTEDNNSRNGLLEGEPREEKSSSAVVEREEPQQRASRCNLKLDLSKIPQHSFRNATAKKDSPRSDDSPKSGIQQNPPSECCLSKVTHRASIAGNKIIIDKPLRAKDVAELKREATECAKIIESHVLETPATRDASDAGREREQRNDDQRPNDHLVVPSPTADEPESFDSWSMSSSTELNQPTSPSHSLFARNDTNNSDNSESMIDRIRRRSFYSRFNDRRRPSLAAPPPGVLLPSSSATLPRKFSLAGHHREYNNRGELRDRGRYAVGFAPKIRHNTGAEKSYVHGDDGIGRTGHRYSDVDCVAGYVTDLKSPTDYDPLGRYLRSPTFDLSSRSRYHSADFVADPEPTTVYRSPLSSLSNDSGLAAARCGYSSLPRKYGITEPKTVEYYEELLSPAEYLSSVARRSPLSGEYPTRCENGYYSENSDLRSHPLKLARRSCAENSARTNQELSDAGSSDPTSPGSCCDEQSTEHGRNNGELDTETKHSLSTPAEAAGRCATDYS